jgi:hypothetical protein
MFTTPWSHMSPGARLLIVRRLTLRRKSRQRLRPRRRRHEKLGQSYSSAKDLSQGDKDDLHPHANSRSK